MFSWIYISLKRSTHAHRYYAKWKPTYVRFNNHIWMCLINFNIISYQLRVLYLKMYFMIWLWTNELSIYFAYDHANRTRTSPYMFVFTTHAQLKWKLINKTIKNILLLLIGLTKRTLFGFNNLKKSCFNWFIVLFINWCTRKLLLIYLLEYPVQSRRESYRFLL